MATHIITDALFLEHEMGEGHPESPARLMAILDHLERHPIAGTVRLAPRVATDDELRAVHGQGYLTQLKQVAGRSVQLDPDTATSPRSIDAARLAAGAAVQATLDVLSGSATNAFALVRPPGHHAEADHAMGFCIINNVAVAAEAARRAGAERVLIVDWDVHHGNGTQHTFEQRDDVLFCSTHRWPFYPGTGAVEEVGVGRGRGFTVNCPLPPRTTDADYGAIFESLILPIGQAFKPDLVLVSAGFDPHAADLLGGMQVTERGFAAMCSALKQLAETCCKGKLVLCLEGGYNLDALATSVHACLGVLAGNTESFPSQVSARARTALNDALAQR